MISKQVNFNTASGKLDNLEKKKDYYDIFL